MPQFEVGENGAVSLREKIPHVLPVLRFDFQMVPAEEQLLESLGVNLAHESEDYVVS